MILFLTIAFAGVWHLVADYSILVILAGGCIALAFLSQFIPVIGPFLGKLRIDFLWAAAVFVAMLIWGGHIQHDTDLRWQAKQAVLNQAVGKIVTSTTPRPNAKHKAPADKWDNPKN